MLNRSSFLPNIEYTLPVMNIVAHESNLNRNNQIKKEFDLNDFYFKRLP